METTIGLLQGKNKQLEDAREKMQVRVSGLEIDLE